MRPVTAMSGNRLEFSDVNLLYRDHMLVNNSLHELKDMLPPEELQTERKDLYNGAKAIMGFGEPISPSSKGRGLKGIALQLAGSSSPKKGFFQSKVIGKKQDFSGRATITNDPTLGLNEIGVPKDMLWSMYKMHIIRDLVQKGYPYVEAEKAYEAKNEAGLTSFKKMTEHIPIILNRAPTLMKSNITAFMPKPIDGKTVTYNPLNLKLIAGDFDGDAVSMFLPITPESISEAKDKILPQSQLYDFRKGMGVSLVQPDHEAILGAVHLSEPDMAQKVVEFKTEADALKALKEGKIKDNTPIRIKAK
jgi:DNA-directed RNA polymerase subunit beta'